MKYRRGTPLSSRRRFLRAGGLAAISAVVPSLGCDRNEVTFRDRPTGPDLSAVAGADLPAPPITANDRFYLQSFLGSSYDPRLQA